MSKEFLQFSTNPELILPKCIYELAENPDNIVIKIERVSAQHLSVLVYERNSSLPLTDQTAWSSWQAAINASRREHNRNGEISFPEPPSSIHRLHAQLAHKILDSTLTITDRILLTFELHIAPERPDVLYVGAYDGEIGRGIATEFYTATLPVIAKAMEARFITGSNSRANIDFFVHKLGRVRLNDICEEYWYLFFGYLPLYPEERRKNLTVQFVYPEDTGKYLTKRVV